MGVEEGYKTFPILVLLFLREQPDLCGDPAPGAECSGCEKVTPRKPGGGVPGSWGHRGPASALPGTDLGCVCSARPKFLGDLKKNSKFIGNLEKKKYPLLFCFFTCLMHN